MKFYHEIIQKLKDREPFKFSRWGDGEWLCMNKETGENRDGNTYLPELGKELLKILESQPGYYMGVQYGVFYNENYVHGHQHPSLRDFMIKKMFELPEINWVNGDVLHQASEYGYLQEFWDVLQDRNVIYIGAEYFNKLPFDHVVVPDNNSFGFNDELFDFLTIKGMKDFERDYQDDVYLVSAAMNSNVIIDCLPDEVTAIDIGSVFDPYLGIERATYQRNVKLKPLW